MGWEAGKQSCNRIVDNWRSATSSVTLVGSETLANRQRPPFLQVSCAVSWLSRNTTVFLLAITPQLSPNSLKNCSFPSSTKCILTSVSERNCTRCRRFSSRQNLTEECGSPNPRRAERGTTPSTRVVCLQDSHLHAGGISSPPLITTPEFDALRVESCARCALGMTGKRTSLLQFFEKPEDKLPAFSSVLFHAFGFDAWPHFP